MNSLGPQGVADRMSEIERRIDALSAPSTRSLPSFADTLNSMNRPGNSSLPLGNGILNPSILGGNPIQGAIGGASTDLRTMAQQAAQKYGLEPKLFEALVTQESGWNPQATSSVGAKGLCQLMDGTAKDMGVDNPYDAQQSLEGGARYLRRMLDVNHGDVHRALASYNAGPGRVMGRSAGEWPQETQHYVRSILAKAGGIA